MDDNGTLIDNATLRVRNQGTVNLASIYTSATLATPLTNPIPVSAGGVFAQIYAPLGTQFDIALLNGTGGLVRQWLAVDALGSDANTFERIFSGARVQLHAGDIGDGTIGLNFEAGDPSPDDIGGTMRIGGWAGTSLDRLDIEAVHTNISGDVEVLGGVDVSAVRGISEGGRKLSEVVFVPATTFTAVSTVDIALTNLPTGTREWIIDFWDVLMGTTTTGFLARLSYDGGVTYKAGAADYAWTYTCNSGGSPGLTQNVGATSISLSPTSLVKDTSWLARIQLCVTTMDSGAGNTIVAGRVSGAKNDVGGGTTFVPAAIVFDGVGLGNYGRATNLRLLMNSGVVTGKYGVRTQRGTFA